MNCTTCGADLPPGAKFCAECGARAEAVDDEATTVIEPVTGPVVRLDSVDTPVADGPHPHDHSDRDADTEITGARHRERGVFGEFTAAISPILRSPRVTANLLAAGIALAISIAVSVVLWALAEHAFSDHSELLLPPFVEPGEDSLGIVSLLTSVLHQVPLTAGDNTYANAPLLLALVPLLACAIGVRVARRAMPCSSEGRFLVRTVPFAVAYGVLLLIWSMFGAQDWHGAHLRELLYGIAFAVAGASLHDRLLAQPATHGPTMGSEPGSESEREHAGGRFVGALLTAARVLAMMLAIGALGLLVVSTIEAVDGEDTGAGITNAILQVAEGGFEAVGLGVLAESYPRGIIDEDGVRLFEADELLTAASFVVLLVTSLGIVLVGGLFSGFAIARSVAPRSRNDHLMYGAVTGPVWAVAMLFAQLFVLTRAGDDDATYTSFDGVETFFCSLLVGAVLGALGGLLAASRHEPASII